MSQAHFSAREPNEKLHDLKTAYRTDAVKTRADTTLE
jgi:hypothetical protein